MRVDDPYEMSRGNYWQAGGLIGHVQSRMAYVGSNSGYPPVAAWRVSKRAFSPKSCCTRAYQLSSSKAL